MTKVISKARSKWESLNNGTQRLASIITAIIVIGGAFFGGVDYIVNQLDEHIKSQTSEITSEIKDVKLSSTRNELMLLIKTSPENTLEIEKVAKYYFTTLNGDWWMSGFYSDWAHKYGGDTSFVTK